MLSSGISFYFLLICVPAPLSPPCCSSGFRTVSFTLQSRDVLSTVTNVLEACSLPVEHMSRLQASTETASSSFYRPIRWDKSYYSFTGFRDPEEDLQQARRMEPTLRWLPQARASSDVSG